MRETGSLTWTTGRIRRKWSGNWKKWAASDGVHLAYCRWGKRKLQEMEELGYLTRSEQGKRLGQLGNAAIIDVTNPDGREYVWSKIKKNYYEKGIHIFWLDEAEPEFTGYEFSHYRISGEQIWKWEISIQESTPGCLRGTGNLPYIRISGTGAEKHEPDRQETGEYEQKEYRSKKNKKWIYRRKDCEIYKWILAFEKGNGTCICSRICKSYNRSSTLTVYLPSKHITGRGDCLNIPMLTLTLSSPMEGVIKVSAVHHAGALYKGPFAQVNQEDPQVEITQTDTQVIYRSGSLKAVIDRPRQDINCFL